MYFTHKYDTSIKVAYIHFLRMCFISIHGMRAAKCVIGGNVNFPDKYRFVGVQFFMSMDRVLISRDVLGLL